MRSSVINPNRLRSKHVLISRPYYLRTFILLPFENEPPIIQGRETCEVANGRGRTIGRGTAVDGQASRRIGDQPTQRGDDGGRGGSAAWAESSRGGGVP